MVLCALPEAKVSCVAILISIFRGGPAFNSMAAEPNWAGEYAEKNFLNGQAVFELAFNNLETPSKSRSMPLTLMRMAQRPMAKGREKRVARTSSRSIGKIASTIQEQARLRASATGLSCQ
jgi:hypothetical protein